MLNWRLSGFYFVYFCTLGVIVPYWSLFLQYRGFTATEIGQLMAIMLGTKVFAPYLWASVADFVNIRHGTSLMIVKFATGVTFLFYCLLFVLDGFVGVALAILGYCLFWNATLPQIEAATLNYLNENKHRYGNIRLWGSVGFIITTLVVGYLIDAHGPRVVLPAGAVVMLMVFVASFFILDSKQVHSPGTISQKLPIQSLFNSQVVLLLVVAFFMQLSHAPFYSFFSIYLEQYGYSKTQIGWLWSTGVIFEIVIFIYGYHLLKSFSLNVLLSFTMVVAALRWYLVTVQPDSFMLLFITQTMHAITYGLYHSVMVQLIHHYFKGRYQIRGQAIYGSVTYGLGGAVGSVASGYIWTYYGPTNLFLMASAVMLIAVFICVFMIKAPDQRSIN